MTYNICHRSTHVTLGRSCTSTPYSDLSLYDGDCYPHELALVGLVPESEIEHLGEEAPTVICNSVEHVGASRYCVTVPRDKVGPDTSADRTPHNWVPYYAEGDFILVRTRVIKDSFPKNSRTMVQIGIASRSLWVERDEVLGLAANPVPPEPDRKLVLRSQVNGRFIGFQAGVWKYLDTAGATGLEWVDVWRSFGPFDTFEPQGEIK